MHQMKCAQHSNPFNYYYTTSV